MDYVSALEKVLGIKAKKNFMELQPGDVLITSSDTSRLENFIGYKPATTIEVGIKKFVDWYISFKGLNVISRLSSRLTRPMF